MAAKGLEGFGTIIVGIIILTVALFGARVITKGILISVGLTIAFLFVIANLIAIIYGVTTSGRKVEG
jgi:hypothetical protein